MDRAEQKLACNHNQPGEQSSFVDAHYGDGQRFIVRADEKLTAFMELEAAICVSGEARHENWLTDLRGFH